MSWNIALNINSAGKGICHVFLLWSNLVATLSVTVFVLRATVNCTVSMGIQDCFYVHKAHMCLTDLSESFSTITNWISTILALSKLSSMCQAPTVSLRRFVTHWLVGLNIISVMVPTVFSDPKPPSLPCLPSFCFTCGLTVLASSQIWKGISRLVSTTWHLAAGYNLRPPFQCQIVE